MSTPGAAPMSPDRRDQVHAVPRARRRSTRSAHHGASVMTAGLVRPQPEPSRAAGAKAGWLGPGWDHPGVRWLVGLMIGIGWLLMSDATVVEPADARADCSHRKVSWRVNRFADDFSHQRLRRTDRAFSSRREFRWYSTTAPGARLDPEARRRNTLRAYFRQRMAQQERLRIKRLGSFYEEKRHIRHLNGRLVRRAGDLAPTVFRFKGAFSCRTGKLIVWSMAAGDL
jgi:hypothetical protein